jgi:hypothetical protein
VSAAGAGGTFVPGGADASTPADIEAGRKQLATVLDPSVRFSDVTELTRTAIVRCTRCQSSLEVHQSRPRTDEAWSNDIAGRMAAFGWVQDSGGRSFCGKTCAAHYAVQMRDHGGKPLPAVERIGDASYAKKMYTDAAQTTPAAPPVVTQKQAAKPPQQPQPRR